MAEDKKIHEQPVPTVAKPDTDAKLRGAPAEPEADIEQPEPEAEIEQPEGDGDHTAAGLIRQAWALKEASGMHEVDVRGRDAPAPKNSLGASVARGDVAPMPPVGSSTGEKMSRRRARNERQASREATPRPEDEGRRGEEAGPEGEPGKRR